jgi:hypothetical protein
MSRWPVFVAAILLADPVRADEPRAASLFEQGRTLAREGRCVDAIPILLESVKELPGVGALLNLGLCYETLGKTSTAYRYFLRAEELAASHGDPRRADAKERASALERRLSSLTVRVAQAPSEPDLALRIDGEPLPRERWNAAEPIDPGVHVIEATSTRRASKVVLRVLVGADHDAAEVVVPAAPERPPERRADLEAPRRTLRPLGWTLGGVGAGALALGGIFGALSKADHDTLVERCPSYPTCDAALRSDVDGVNDSARTKGTIATVSFVAGGVLLVSGVLLLLAR